MNSILQVSELSTIFHSLQGEQLSNSVRESLIGFRFRQPVEQPFLRFFVLRTRRLVLCAAVLFSAFIVLGLISVILLNSLLHPQTLYLSMLIGLSSLLLSCLILRQAYRNTDYTWFYRLITPLVGIMPVAFNLILFTHYVPDTTQTMTATIGLFYATFLTTLLLRLRLNTNILLFILLAGIALLIVWSSGKPLAIPLDLHAICAIIFGVVMCAVIEFDARCDFLSQAQIYHIATTDPLSKALNRHALFERGQMELDRARRYANPLTLLLLDIDRFKQVNDRFGHLIGDQVITYVGELGRKSLRSSDLLGRIGGEEFAILLPDTDLPAGVLVAERLRHAMDQHISTPNGILHVTLSIGVVQLQSSEKLLQEMIGRADECLYEAKRSGRNRVITEETNQEELLLELAVAGNQRSLTNSKD